MMTAPEIYHRLYEAYGQPRWWSDEPYTVMVQSVLVQNTAWTSVESVTEALFGKLTPAYLSGLKTEALEALIRPCGFCKGKAAAIQRLTAWYESYDCEAEKVKAVAQNELRKQLLAIKGVGAETADVILVYAFYKPAFIVDAYTRRFLERLGFLFHSDDEIRRFFTLGLEKDAWLYGWCHWLLLEHSISHCRKTPLCRSCPFNSRCRYRAGGDVQND